MKLLICVFAAAAGLCSFGLEITPLPPSDFPDTEIATNFPFAVAAPSHRLAFSLEFQSTVSNSLEVAIGRDANEDGELSLDEASLAVGYDCGEWFVRSAANDSVLCETLLHEGWVRRVYEVRSRNIDPAWNLARVTRRGRGASNENVTVEMRQTGFGITLQ